MSRSSKIGFSFEGLKQYMGQMEELNDNLLKVCEQIVYVGAAEVADSCKGELNGLPTTSTGEVLQAWKTYQKTGKAQPVSITKEQKDGLIESMGLAKMRNDAGFINTKLGFDGYNSVVTNRWPKGQPNAMIARSINSGSSAFRKDPFMQRVERQSKGKAISAMKKRCDELMKKYSK